MSQTYNLFGSFPLKKEQKEILYNMFFIYLQYNSKIIINMKRLSSFLSMLVVAYVATMCSVSCSSSSDDPNTPPESTKATTVDMQAGFYITYSAMKLYDIYVIDSDGNKTQINRDNTTEDNEMSFGSIINKNKKSYVAEINKYNDKLYLYKFKAETLKSFPKTLSYKIVATVNGKQLADNETFVKLFIPVAEIKNNTKENAWENFSFSSTITTTVVSGNNWSKYAEKYNTTENTLNLTFESANSFKGSVK